jgi:hypothetical protein
MSDIHDMVICADVRNFELAITTKAFNTFYYKTEHPLEDVLAPSYFDSVIEVQPRKNDRIEVLASCTRLLPEYATLAIANIVTIDGRTKRITVTLLFCNK